MLDTGRLDAITTFPRLVDYLRDELDWPIDRESFEDLTFEYTPDDLGLKLDGKKAQIKIHQLRPLEPGQPWGIFFLDFPGERLPVTVLRRILGKLAITKRGASKAAERAAWQKEDLLFIASHGEKGQRQLTFAHFHEDREQGDLPTLKVLGWDGQNTLRRLSHTHATLKDRLCWPDDVNNAAAWRETWGSAFTEGVRQSITTSKIMAEELARLARQIRARANILLEAENEKGPLRRLLKAFQEALIHDLDEDGFADMYAQTIAYGLLSARISRASGALVADNVADMAPPTNPFLKELLETFLKAGGRKGEMDFDELGVNDVVEMLRDDNTDMKAVLRDFDDHNPQEDPVIHFYELFLKEYDAKKRMQRGVFYTPRSVVSYIVRSVHELLQTEFGLADGLADTMTWREMVRKNPRLELPDGVKPDDAFVQILDPATGTATFLVEVIDVIHRTLAAKWTKQRLTKAQQYAAWNDYVPKHLLPRLHGYELMMAPYAIAHMKIGLKLYETGYRFGTEERARIYLTNALEPWMKQLRLPDFAVLAHEAAAVNEIKQHKRFTVVIGNPPYSIQSQNLSETARLWVDRYRRVAGIPIAERNALQFEKNIQDDYIKFIRLSEVAVDCSGFGIVGLVTNHGFLDGATFRGMRWSLLETFTNLWILDLHGNSNKREVAPGGSKDDNVFDIAQGVAISLLTRNPLENRKRGVGVAGIWGQRADDTGGKYGWLLSHSCGDTSWESIVPVDPLFMFKPSGGNIQREYETYSSLPEIMPLYSMGIKSSRDELVLDFESGPLIERIEKFRSARFEDEEICEELGVPLKKGWNVAKARRDLRTLKELGPYVQRFLYRPFDWRLLFYHRAVVFSAAYPIMQHLLSGTNIALVATRQTKDQWDFQCSRTLVGHKSLGAYDANSVFPLYVKDADSSLALSHTTNVNISNTFTRQLKRCISSQESDSKSAIPEDILYYAYAVFHSPGYRTRYADQLKADFPRLPLPGGFRLFRDLASLGGDLVALHLMESPKLNQFITSYKGPKAPVVSRVGWSDDTVWLDAAATKKGQVAAGGTIGFYGVSEDVWRFYIGGYQVCEKWLKDRKDRALSKADITHYQKIVVALTETMRLMKEIDRVIDAHGGWPGAFAANAG